MSRKQTTVIRAKPSPRVKILRGSADPIRIFSDYGYGLTVQIGWRPGTISEWRQFYKDILANDGYTENEIQEYGKVISDIWEEHKHTQPKQVYFIHRPVSIITPIWAHYLNISFNGSVLNLYDKVPDFRRWQPGVRIAPADKSRAADGLYEINAVEISI